MTTTVRPAPATTTSPAARAWEDVDLGGVLLAAAGVAAVLAAVAFWVAGGGVPQLWSGGAAQTWQSLGRLSGLVGSVLLLGQVLLLARVPWVERSLGQDRATRWHRTLGVTSLLLVAVHVGTVTWGYALAAATSWPAEVWRTTTQDPGMLLAAVGTVALAGVGVTSAVGPVRRRLRYETWHLLHLYAYLGVGLALPHQLWTGADFASSPSATAFWWTLWALAVAAVLVFRVGVPVALNLRHRLVVERVVPEGDGTVSVVLGGRGLHRLRASAGQFFLWRFGGPGVTRAHPYSLSAPVVGDRMRISVKALGDGSAAVATLRPGTRAYVEGPFGRLTADRLTGRDVLLLAGGIGLTPLLAVAHEVTDGRRVDLVHRTRDAEDVAFAGELAWLASERGLRVHHLPGPRAGDGSWLPTTWAGVDDMVALRHLVPDLAERDVLVCGPDPWADAVEAAVLAAGVPAGRVHRERFGW